MARAIAYDKRFPETRVWPGAHWEYSNMVTLDQLPGKGRFTYFRLYGPTEAYFSKQWALPDIVEIR
jgi:hypothetical protein